MLRHLSMGARYRYRFCVPADEVTGWNLAESLIAYDMVNNVVIVDVF